MSTRVPSWTHVAEHGGLCAFPEAPQPRTVLSGGLALWFVHNKLVREAQTGRRWGRLSSRGFEPVVLAPVQQAGLTAGHPPDLDHEVPGPPGRPPW